MYVVAELFAVVPEDHVLTTLEVASGQITEEAMQLHTGMIRTSDAACAQTARRDAVIAAVLLDQYVGRHFGRAERRVRRLVDGQCFRNPVLERRVAVLPTGGQLATRNRVRQIAVHLV